jgi:uncharacterized repeat protein (TIGR03803 family)
MINSNHHTSVCLHKRTLAVTHPLRRKTGRALGCLDSTWLAIGAPATFFAALMMWLIAAVLLHADVPGATITRLHSFGENGAIYPHGQLTEGSDGALYGITLSPNAIEGTVFRATKDGSVFTVLKKFDASVDGLLPSGVTEGSDGALYGTCGRGLSGDGIVFRLNNDGGGFTVLKELDDAIDGANPSSGVIEGMDGMLYGTARSGGSFGYGTVFRINKNGSGFAVLRNFNRADGSDLNAGLTEGTDGVLYGTTVAGGTLGGSGGTVFRLNKDGSGFAVLKSFDRFADGASLWNRVIESNDGALYGTTQEGGPLGPAGCGTVFRLRKDGSEFTIIKNFSFPTVGGAGPLSEGSDGALYGATESGGTGGGGTVFRLTKDGASFAVLKEFDTFNTDNGAYPTGITQGRDGMLYGIARVGGGSFVGVLFRLNRDGSGFNVFKNFSRAPDGAFPSVSGLINGGDGRLYGTTMVGGVFDRGTVFSMNEADAEFTVLKSFNPTVDGAVPYGVMIAGSDGLLYGTTSSGGTMGWGTVFRLHKSGTGFTVLKGFDSGSDGGDLSGGLLEGSDGRLYGTANGGGTFNGGTLFRLNKDGTGFTLIKSFNSATDGRNFYGALIEGTDGALYGTAYQGGNFDAGTLFRLKTDGTEFVVLKHFDGTQSGFPFSGVIEGRDGALFGALEGGGFGYGVIFRVNKDGSGCTILKSFNNAADGAYSSRLTEAHDGYLYGAAYQGGTFDFGTIFRLHTDGTGFQVLQAIGGTPGGPRFPSALSIGPHGRLYAASNEGGDTGAGTVFAVDFLAAPKTPNSPVLSLFSSASALANGSGFTLFVNGTGFQPNATAYWNDSARSTTFINSSQISAEIPAADLISTANIATATVTVKNGSSAASNPLAFSIVAQSVGNAVAAVVPAGGTATASTAPATSGEAGVTLSVSNTGGDPITATAATYDSRPVGETAFRVDNGAFVDVQITGADASDSATVFFYYPSTVTGGQENSVKLRYFDGANWITVLGSGGTAPVKSTTDNLDGTVSGGRFAVVLDNTSTPKITELSGTVFGMFNTTPQIGTLSGPTAPLALGMAATISVPFAVLGDWRAARSTFIWDDGSQTTVTPFSSSLASATKTYAAAGVYTVTVRVVDEEGSSVEARFEYAVVYDPNGGFVTGGGWIQSPAGAYAADLALSGKANFGFVSKYQKGATLPTGETEFQLHFATFNFKSTSYQWLVVPGAKAQYKGSGTINGSGDYGFLLTATDGQINGGGGADKFRIKIWNKSTGATVYDNVPSATDDLDTVSPQAISGGSIVVKK